MRDDDELAEITIGDITVDTSDVNTQEWDDWITQYTGALDLNMDLPHSFLQVCMLETF